jgi:hypothetical protein
MSTMTRVQAEALAAFIVRLRTDWRPAGVVAALEKAAPNADPFDVARALINLASEPSVKTPGLLPGPGPHWRNPEGEIPGRRGDHDIPCVDHPSQVHPCPTCRAEKPPLSPEAIAELRAIAAEAKTRVPRPKFGTSKREADDREQRREDARRRADAEVDR